jgi:phosphoribosylamine--glycine ligase
MRVLIIGGGGREHAIAWRLKRDDASIDLIAAPGNPGIAELAECFSIAATDLPGLERLASELAVDLTIVGPEAPLALGIVDRFRAAGLPIFGPTREAAELETSKAFAKQLMLDEGIPTARAQMHSTVAGAMAAARAVGAPVVIKASGLAAGKGVLVCDTLEDAERAIGDMLEGNRFGDAGHVVLVEEFMRGEEISVFAITNGRSFVVLPALQDHKRLLDGDHGPNTGGMGAYVLVSFAGAIEGDTRFDATREAALSVFIPTLRAMAERGRPFTGLLYAGLMLTSDGAKVVEFNCRFGDPETEALLPVLTLQPSLMDMMLMVATGAPLGGMPVMLESLANSGAAAAGVRYSAGVESACVTTVLAAANYPDRPRTGDPITIPPPPDGVYVFHAGTARTDDGQLVTAGGRVLAVSASGATVADAQQRCLAFCDRIVFDGMQRRSDIGWREIARADRA